MEYDTLLHDEDENRSSMEEWIKKTFKRRECIRYVKTKNSKCGCGRLFNEHKKILAQTISKNVLNRQSTLLGDTTIGTSGKQPWRIQDNTDTFPTNAFGTIEFQGADIYTTKAEYIRLSFDTKPQNIIKLLKNYWQLEWPKLIISVHGGIANYGLQPKLKQAIHRGLIKVANTSQIWIITAGTDTGVVKHIGDILKEYYPKSRNNLVEIGIAPWGVVNERETLIGEGIEVPYYSNNNQTINSSNGFNLNNCHSYFLLVDDGTVGKYGCEISFRRRFERFLSRHKSEIFMDFDLRPKVLDVVIDEKITIQNHHTIPLVCLVIEGGTNTIQTVLVNVSDKPPVPVVVCDGSGRAADLIAFTHKYVYINPVTKRATMDADIHEQLISTIMKTFAYTRKQADYLFIQLMACVKNKDLISIYRLGDESDHEIDLAILTASLKVIDLKLDKQLDVIMSWNRPDIAKKYILLQGSETEKKILDDKMFEALSQDKVDFVKLLLEYGVNLQKFLTIQRIQDLYNCKKGPSNTLILIIKDVIKKLDSKYRVSLLDIGLVVDKLIGNGYVSEYSKREFKSKYFKYLNKKSSNNLNTNSTTAVEDKDECFKYPYNELLIWAILMKRHKMAMFVCKRGEETLAKALVAAKLNKALAREAELDDLESEVSDEFKKYAEEFSTLAVGLLDKCYKEDDELTSQLLTYDLVNWSHWTCLSLAVVANLKDFLSHAACQLLISDLWMGGMKIRKYVTYKVITALLFPPALFAIQFKSAKELQYMPQTQEEYEHDLENQDSISSLSSSRSNSINSNIHLNDLIASSIPGGKLLNKKSSKEYVFNDDESSINRTNNPVDKALKLDHLIELIESQHHTNHHHQISKTNQTTPLIQQDLMMQADLEKQKKTINFLVKNRTNKLKFGKKIYEFYNAPITKFWQHTIFYVIFLMCFAYIVLAKTPDVPNGPEIYVLVYIFTYGIDKIRELLQTDSPRFSGKIKIFFSRVMNLMDTFFITTIILALIFRLVHLQQNYLVKKSAFIPSNSTNSTFNLTTPSLLLTPDLNVMPSYDAKMIARLIYCVNTIYWIIKLMEFLLINKYTGILIIIASKMLIDLFNFVVILLILLMCFGLSRQAIKYPNEEFKLELVKKIFLEPYFMLYGEVYADTIDPDCDVNEPWRPQCQPGHWITPFTMTVFMIVSCLLFLSVLIASFNNTFVRISRQSAQFWKCQRYHFVTAYESKPLLAPPFVIISHLYMVIKYMIRLCQKKKIKFDRKLKAFLSEEMVQRLHDFEENCFYEYNSDLELSLSNMMEEKINQTRDKVESISARIDDIFFKESVTKLTLYKVELRLQKLEEFNYEAINHLNNLCNMLKLNSNESNFNSRNNSNGNMMPAEMENIHEFNRSFSQQQQTRKRTVTITDTNELMYEEEEMGGGKTSDPKLNKFNRSYSYHPKSLEKDEVNKPMAFQDDINQKEKEHEELEAVIMHENDIDNDENDSVEVKYLQSCQKDENNKIINEERKLILKQTKKELKTQHNEEEMGDLATANRSNSNSNQQNILLTSQSSTIPGLDQYTLHPFVYLHSVVGPPLAEYTSITDCIDTTNIDRPPSPPISSSVTNKSNIFFTLGGNNSNNESFMNKSMKSPVKKSKEAKHINTESARSIVARQESEILRLAEESQHVIISQLLTNLSKKSSNSTPTSASDQLESKNNNLDSVFETEDVKQTHSFNYKKHHVAKISKQKRISEELSDQTSVVNQNAAMSSSSSSRSQLHSPGTIPKSEYNKEHINTMKIPLTSMDRKSSQIFYAQSQANALLCLNVDDEDAPTLDTIVQIKSPDVDDDVEDVDENEV